MKKSILVIAVVILISGVFFFKSRNSNDNNNLSEANMSVAPASNISIENGTQIIEITAKGGYQPRKTIAKAGMPTVLRFDTNGTFDCSSSVRIPSLNISQVLPQSGSTDIDIGNPNVATLQGICGMGMYRFVVDFQG